MKKIILIAVPSAGFNGTFKHLAESLTRVLTEANCVILYPPNACERANHWGVFFALFPRPGTKVSSWMAINEIAAAREAVEALKKDRFDITAILSTQRTANALRKMFCVRFGAKSPCYIRDGKARIIKLKSLNRKPRIQQTAENKKPA